MTRSPKTLFNQHVFLSEGDFYCFNDGGVSFYLIIGWWINRPFCCGFSTIQVCVNYILSAIYRNTSSDVCLHLPVPPPSSHRPSWFKDLWLLHWTCQTADCTEEETLTQCKLMSPSILHFYGFTILFYWNIIKLQEISFKLFTNKFTDCLLYQCSESVQNLNKYLSWRGSRNSEWGNVLAKVIYLKFKL